MQRQVCWPDVCVIVDRANHANTVTSLVMQADSEE